VASDSDIQFGRREMMMGVAAAGAAASLAVAASPAAASPRQGATRTSQGESAAVPSGPALEAPSQDVLRYFGPIAAGTTIGDRWVVEQVHGVRAGAIPVLLRTQDGTRYAVEVMRRADGSGAIDGTERVEVFLSNRADGSTPTPEEQGLGAMALAAALRSREADGALPPALHTHAERQADHPHGLFHIPV